MKYIIGNQVINADHIVRAQYWPAHDNSVSQCQITLTSIVPTMNADGDTFGCSESEVEILRSEAADRFWEAYSRDAYCIVTEREETK